MNKETSGGHMKKKNSTGIHWLLVMKLCFCGDIEVIDRIEGVSCGFLTITPDRSSFSSTVSDVF